MWEMASFYGPPEYCFWARNPGESSSWSQGSLFCPVLLLPILKDDLQTNAAKLTGKKKLSPGQQKVHRRTGNGGVKAIPKGSTLWCLQCCPGTHPEYALVRWDSQTLIGERFNAAGRNSIGSSLFTFHLQFPHSVPKVSNIHRRIQSSLDMAENSSLGLLRR